MKQINTLSREDLEKLKTEVLFAGANNSIDLYQSIATKSAIYPGHGTPLGLAYVALKGAGEAGEFAEHVGKALRDDDLMTLDRQQLPPDRKGYTEYVMKVNQMEPERHALLVKEIGDQLWHLAAKCNELGVKLSDVAVINIEKLLDRTERNALQGSGDTR